RMGARPARRAIANLAGEAFHRAGHAVATERNSLHEKRRLHACEAAQDHRRVEIAEVADAERAAREGPESAGEGDLEAFARDGAKRLDVDALSHFDRRHRCGPRSGNAAMQLERALFAPRLDGRLHGTRERRMAREDGIEAFVVDQLERLLDAVEQVL